MPNMHRPNPLTPSRLYSVKCIAYVIAVQACVWRLKLVAAESDTCSAAFPETCSGEPQTGIILGYVTPWNGRGYDVAKQHRDKLTHISPVWYQLKLQDGAPHLAGGHDADAEWMAELRAPTADEGAVPRIVPRVVVELERPQEYLDMLTGLKADMIKVLTKECKRSRLDGLVLEVWSTWHALGLPQQNFALLKAFLRDLHKALHRRPGFDGEPMELILAIQPPVPAKEGAKPPLNFSQFQQLASFIDGFSVMTYDFNVYGMPGPNAPVSWVKANLEFFEPAKADRGKVLVGLNFYGRDFSQSGMKDVLGHDYTASLERKGAVLHWDEAFQEHKLTYKTGSEKHEVYYPSTKALQARVELAQEYGAGISIWEVGQGLDGFMDVFDTKTYAPKS